MTLTIDHLSTSYGAVQAVVDVGFTAPAGAITCVMGRNGVGKTTLLRTIMGQIKPVGGSVRLGGAEIGNLPAHRRSTAGLALVPQGREIFPKLTVEENLLVGLSARTDGRRTVPEIAYETFPILKDFRKRMGGDLSGGQQQQLAIARALVGEPKALMLDEPTEGIQPNVIDLIGDVLQRLAKGGMTVVLVEQYLDFIKRIGDGYVVLDRGRVVATGAVRDMDAAGVGRYLSV
jgi:urea transport system ATP-binding protein